MSAANTFDVSTSDSYTIQSSNTSSEGTTPAGGLLGSPVRFSPSSKVKVNHGHFMANINSTNPNNKSSSKAATAVSSNSTWPHVLHGLNGSPSKDMNYNSVSGSGKVIETLHQQVDALTSTNLQLTKQSNQLLEKLESYNMKEAKYLETISSLKHENENLNSMLNRKTRRVRDLDTELGQLKVSYEDATTSHKHLKDQLENKFANEVELKQQCQLLQVQYDAVVDAQKRYREHYEKEISELKDILNTLKRDNEQFLNDYMTSLARNQLDVDNKLGEYSGKFHRMELSQKEAVIELNGKYDRLKSELDIEAWVTLYKQLRETALEYAKELDLNLPAEFVEIHGEDGYFVKMFSEDQSPSSTKQSAIAADSANIQSPSLGLQSISPPPLRIPKSRTPTTKRSSFYGSAIPGSNNSASSSAVLLPGVKRTGSIRSVHARAPSDVLSDSPTITSSSRNASPVEFPQRGTVRHSSVQRHNRRNQSSQLTNNK
ncbi:She3p Ecym_3434 [Eremothecium cymbalariae DBVPG|uniref:SWI5-dependent HO expression protein 3 n=1 Tax=Eremothecium cymbalariae (strain CBS 270.75 / DBVPG 7215 / KCTC 17166 / NRRL Y-17582) TaxID=931890 RepID=G8JS01_ERECY|nr:Hypothetical protein Ecym_3434 [Eremothecium cymbalariae DBVPG\